MSYPLIILGAGASAGYHSDSNLCPPITKDLLKPEHISYSALNQYPLVANLFSLIEIGVNDKKQNFEDTLDKIIVRSNGSVTRQAQLVALQFYLRDLFMEISNKCEKMNHYKALQSHISDYSKNKACVVSFNYDTLFEESFTNNPWSSINQYVQGDIKLIKLHGSQDWSYIYRKESIRFGGASADDYSDAYAFAISQPQFLSNLRTNGGQPYHNHELTKERGNFFEFPALAVPMLVKDDLIICPNSHIEALKQELTLIDRILIIGWQGVDQFLLNLIREKVKPETKFILVSKSSGNAEKLALKFSKSTGLNGRGCGGGFRKFIDHDLCYDFFTEVVNT